VKEAGTLVEPAAAETMDGALTAPPAADAYIAPPPAVADAYIAPPAAVIFPAVEPAQSEQAAPEAEHAAEVSVLEQPPPPTQPARPGATPEAVLATLKTEWPADLVQVETDPGKVQPMPDFEDLLGSRAGRTRPVLAPVPDEPLIQVETRKRDLPAGDSPRTPEANPA
jgi:hypothetical protein